MKTSEAFAWLLRARRTLLAIGRRADGPGAQLATAWLIDFEAAVIAARGRGEADHDVPLIRELGPLARESGGSIPDTLMRTLTEMARSEVAAAVESPLLNKSGGSDVGSERK